MVTNTNVIWHIQRHMGISSSRYKCQRIKTNQDKKKKVLEGNQNIPDFPPQKSQKSPQKRKKKNRGKSDPDPSRLT